MATKWVATTGSNSASGTEGSPWKTIQHGVDEMTPGDTLKIKPGVYKEKVTITNNGKELQRITIEAQYPRTVEIAGTWNVNFSPDVYDKADMPSNDDWPSYGDMGRNGYIDGAQVHIQSNYITIRGLVVRNTPYRAIQAGTAKTKVKEPEIDNCETYLVFENGINCYDCDDPWIHDCYVHECSLRGRFRDARRIVPRGIHKGKVCNNHPVVVSMKHSKAPIIEDNIVDNSGGEGIGIGTCGRGGGRIRRNQVSRCKTVGIYFDWPGEDVIVERNVLYTTQFRRVSNTKNKTTAIVFRDEKSQDGKCKEYTHTKNAKVLNNLIVGYGAAFTVSGSQANMDGVKIYGNTVVGCEVAWDVLGYDPNEYGRTWSTIDVRNNAFFCPPGDTNPSGPGKESDFTWTWDYNAWKTNPSYADSRGSNDVTTSNFKLVNPNHKFTFDTFDPANYAPAKGSALIGAGDAVAELTEDYNGNLRKNPPTMGCFEVGSAPAAFVDADFTWSPVYSVEPATIDFEYTGSSTSSVTNYAWKKDGVAFGGNSATPQLTGLTSGTYSIELTVTTADGSDTITQSVPVGSDTPQVGTCSGNLLSNGDFATDLSDWAGNDTTRTWNVGGWMDISNINEGSSTEVRQSGFAMTEGVEYELTFEAKSTVDGDTMEVEVIEDVANYPHIVPDQSFVLTTSWQTFTQQADLICSKTVTDARFRFRWTTPINADGTISVRNICLRPKTALAPIASFTLDASSVVVGTAVALESTSENEPSEYIWEIKAEGEDDEDYVDFIGDDSGDEAVFFTNDFGPGVWIIRLTVGRDGLYDSAEETITVSQRRDVLQRNLRRHLRRGMN